MAVDFTSPVQQGDLNLSRPQERHDKYLDEWIAWREEGIHTQPWSESYKRLQLQYIQKYFERWPVISSHYLETWLRETSVMQKTLRTHKHAPVSSYAKFLESKGILNPDECRKIKALYPKKSPYYHPEQKIIYKEDLEVILKAADEDGGRNKYQRILNKTLIIFLSQTALRVSEMCNLTLSDLRFNEDAKHAWVRVRFGKGGKERFVPFSQVAQQVIREYLANRPEKVKDEKQLFWAFNPKFGYTPLNSSCVARRFQGISERCGIPFSAHSFRHYRITRWANNPKIPITVTQNWAGHTSLIVTQRYIHTRHEEALVAAFYLD